MRGQIFYLEGLSKQDRVWRMLEVSKATLGSESAVQEILRFIIGSDLPSFCRVCLYSGLLTLQQVFQPLGYSAIVSGCKLHANGQHKSVRKTWIYLQPCFYSVYPRSVARTTVRHVHLPGFFQHLCIRNALITKGVEAGNLYH